MRIVPKKLKTTITVILLIFGLVFHAMSQNTYKSTTAIKGEGIMALLRRNGLDPVKYMEEFKKINQSQLNKKDELIAGKTYYLPGISGASTFAIFGKAYETVEILDQQLKGATYYLISGHGGPDPGAVSTIENQIVCEDEYNYDITLRLARNLIQHGALVYMITRDINDGIRDDRFLPKDSDELCYPDKTIPRNQMLRLRQRTNAVNKLYLADRDKFQRVIIIHMDSRSRNENLDVYFYYDSRSKSGKKMSNILLNKLKEKYNQHQPGRGYDGTVTTRNLYVLQNTYPTATFIELGNMNHSQNQKRFLIADNRQALANWLTEGLIQDFNEDESK